MTKIDMRTNPAAKQAVTDLTDGLQAVLAETDRFSLRVGETFKELAREDLGDALTGITTAAQPIFQKWTLEMVYLLALSGTLRFRDFKSGLKGISSRTLSLKLSQLERLGIITRTIHGDRPVRVEYSLTRMGARLSALTVPVVFYVYSEFGQENARQAEEPHADAETAR